MKSKWISVDDLRPENEQLVFVLYGSSTYDTTLVGTSRYVKDFKGPHFVIQEYGFHVTHWMPIPDLPKEVHLLW